MNNAPELDFRFPISPTAAHQSAVPPSYFAAASSSTCFDADTRPHKKPRKKRTKLIRIDADDDDPATSTRVARPKYSRKPDPAAPKITTPCTECGKKFWSWKALFGHMRCHPERQWRGIDPPPNLRRPVSPNGSITEFQLSMGEADHEAASSLLMLASGSTIEGPTNEIATQSVSTGTFHGAHEVFDGGTNNGKFECSSCKKVFGSHQALGGHRASHKNVKGCFAITKSDGEVDQDHQSHQIVDGDHDHLEVSNVSNVNNVVMVLGQGHKCNVCLRVFASGQALGGHMRCHWDKGEEMIQLGLNQQAGNQLGLGLDLNFPANAGAAAVSASNVEDEHSSSYSSSGLTLDLRLGL